MQWQPEDITIHCCDSFQSDLLLNRTFEVNFESHWCLKWHLNLLCSLHFYPLHHPQLNTTLDNRSTVFSARSGHIGYTCIRVFVTVTMKLQLSFNWLQECLSDEGRVSYLSYSSPSEIHLPVTCTGRISLRHALQMNLQMSNDSAGNMPIVKLHFVLFFIYIVFVH